MWSAQSPDPPYLHELIGRAQAAKLHQQRYWLLLLHAQGSFTGAYESEVDEAGFFLAPNGKTDAQAELAATLKQFFSTELVGRSRQPARCAFIARFTWLKKELAIDESQLPPEPCVRFHAWLAELNPASITLIFPSAYMNNPSSMFGHLLLRVDQKGQTEASRILAYTINYAADIPPGAGAEFVIQGVFGGYTGFYSTIPYYLKAKEYGDFENRDIWEYRLNLSNEQIERLLMHAWELGNASFDYFFFRENCAYHILSLIDIADPEIHLTDHFWFYTLPTDGVRIIAERPELVKEISFRPSRRSKILSGRESLSIEDHDWLKRIVAAPALAQSEAFSRLSEKQRAAILDVASDYFLYKSATEKDGTAFESANKTVLVARSRLKVASASAALNPVTGPPDEGHRAMRAGIGVGWRAGEFFNEWSFRLAYHDLLDPEYGYTADAQIEALAVTLRRYAQRDHTRIENATLVNIVSLTPIDALFAKPSWKISSGFDTIEHNDCRFCRIGHLDGGIGATAESHLLRREVYYGFADMATEYGRVFNGNYRIGGGATLGTLIDITARWKIAASAHYVNFPLGDKTGEWRFSAQQRFTLQKNFALRFDFNQRQNRREYILNLLAYF